jgi:hypothetical protein
MTVIEEASSGEMVIPRRFSSVTSTSDKAPAREPAVIFGCNAAI